jgi:hypothetical protein
LHDVPAEEQPSANSLSVYTAALAKKKKRFIGSRKYRAISNVTGEEAMAVLETS